MKNTKNIVPNTFQTLNYNKTKLLPTKTPRAGWECLKIYDSKYTGLVVYATKTLHCIALKD